MSFRITLQPSSRAFDAEADEPLLNAAIRAGIGLPYGCKDGACGSCKCRLLQGEVSHGPHQEKALSAAEAANGLILSCVAHPRSDCVVEARGVTGDGEYPVLKMPGRILQLERLAADVMRMRVQLPANQNFQFKAGQYVDFILRNGERRSYSMANAPHNLGTPAAIELHIRHMPGGQFTDVVFSTMKEKEIVRMEGPFGTFYLREESDKPIVMLASGTGLAPIKALLERLQAQGIARPVVLYWGCRRQADLYLHDWAQAQAASLPSLRYVPVLSEPEAGWSGRTGLVHEAVMADLPDLSGHQVYACGAPVMVASARRDFTTRCGLPEDEFFADSFTSAADKAG
ncbi:CDP-6-deoxy-delta-3,4-glucoseen reductase [Ideonella livida]|uniref:CDP-6-deoxy-delta-3,4-glucoseen reductase n=1 Tax=Ideonella livida TaxID=2707176 RepID=A0A7C9TLL9_9BURK|nr:CDP-6-deoxy-delta-3,4-glucoseen reductase [Ideonella livida]NDY91667.1 CDP-6-deoxy-delta-3,4-glucoseen reductase [Ideonella livida]